MIRDKVNLTLTSRSKPSSESRVVVSDGFGTSFTKGQIGLHLLSYLLTGNREKAERCFVAGFEDCATSNVVFKEWRLSWTQRAIVQNAIRLVEPRPKHAAQTMVPPDLGVHKLQMMKEEDAAISNVVALEDFERFVFVLSVLEHYSDRDCSTLLSCSREELAQARMRALEQVREPQSPPTGACRRAENK